VALSRIVAVVPSLGGRLPVPDALDRLRAELAAAAADLVWVHQGGAEPPAISGPRERLVRLPAPVGFARAIHAGLAAGGAHDLIALVNDDLAPEPGWLARLATAIDAEPDVVAVQGVNLDAAAPDLADGCGIAWNRWWQAIQIGHGRPAPPAARAPFEVFGVSATAALYRSRALAAVELAPGRPFDERLGSWYEDVDLAVRLRAAGGRAACIPAARTRHAGSATGARRPFDRTRRVTANRWLVVARLLGRRFPAAIPRLALRDLADLLGAVRRGRGTEALAIAAGGASALLRLGGFARAGAPLVAARELARFRVGSGE
jgi:GT2 family glycosyltransferase